MAINLSDFIKQRLVAYDPSIDVSEGSPAVTEVVDPIVARLGTQPFDIDAVTFIKQRVRENFDIDVEGQFEDLFINPLLTLIDPFTSEQNRIALGQSLVNIDLLTDEEVDDNIANSFEQRDRGGKATTFVRLYYPNPVNLTVTTDKAASTSSGLRYFSQENIDISSSQMLLNREGFEYYADVFVQAENAGEEYNVDPGLINQFEDMKNPIRVTNRFKVTNGKNQETNAQLVQRVEDGRIEKSLNTKRGAISRATDLFPSLRAINMVGAGEVGMDRDILDGTSDGLVYYSFRGAVFGNWIYVQTNSEFFDNSQTIVIGDLIKFKTQIDTIVRKSRVTDILFTSPNQYFLELEDNFPTIYGFTIVGILYKEGFITISKVPGGMLNTTIPSNTVHLGGHDDVYIAPSDNVDQEVIVKNLVTQETALSVIDGETVNGDNKFFTTTPIDFQAKSIRVGDLLYIETGASIGSYEIIYVDSSVVRVDKLFGATESNIHARIIKSIILDTNEPKNIKVPYSGTSTDLSVSIGSTQFITILDLQSFGVVIGDTIEILSGQNVGRYIITSFDMILGGTGPIVDRPAITTQSNVPYRVYSTQEGLQSPFVRIKTIDVLDSSNQNTGIKIPFGDLVDARISCDMDRETPIEEVLDRKLFFIPDFSSFSPITPDPAIPGPTIDARYTQLIESADGVIRKIDFDFSNPIHEAEINIPPFIYNGRRDKILILTSKEDKNFTADIGGQPVTSPVAEGERGNIISVEKGPNIDSYIVQDLRVLQLWGKSFHGHAKVAIAELDKEIRIDPVANIVSIIEYGILQGSGVLSFTFADYFKIFDYASEFFHSNGFIESVLIPRFVLTMGFLGFPITTDIARAFILNTCFSSYKFGRAIEGEIDCYLKEPATVELYTIPISTNDNENISVTTFTELGNNSNKKVQISPLLPPGQVLPQAFSELDITQYDRKASTNYPADDYIYLVGGNYVSQGVRNGDIFEFYPAINDFTSRNIQTSSYLLITSAGSNEVSFIWPSSRNNITALQAGQILAIDSGPDVGIYTVTEVIADTHPNYKVRLNKSLTHSTSAYPTNISFTGATTSLGSNVILDTTLPGSVAVGDWVSLFSAINTSIVTNGDDIAFLGSFKVVGLGLGFMTLDRSAFFSDVVNVGWVSHAVPSNTPAETSNGGRELSTNYVRGRLYSSVKESRSISIDWTTTPNPIDPSSTQQLLLSSSITTLSSTINFSHKSPYRIVRNGSVIISSTDIQKNRENGLYKFTIPIVSLGLTSEYLFKRGTPFKISDSYRIEGYTHIIDNEVLTFSDREIGRLKLPNSILPTGSSYSKLNYLNLGGSNIKITYEFSPSVEAVQQFFISPMDRVACNNVLVRHFLPVYPYIEVTYFGGSSTDIVASEIIKYINNVIADDNQIRSDEINDIAKKKLANQVTMPIELIGLVHGIDRRVRTLRSEDSIGLSSPPIYNGVPKAIAFYAGLDVSNETVIPDLEYVRCTKK